MSTDPGIDFNTNLTQKVRKYFNPKAIKIFDVFKNFAVLSVVESTILELLTQKIFEIRSLDPGLAGWWLQRQLKQI